MTMTEDGLNAEENGSSPDRQGARLARDAIRMAAFGHACWLMARSGPHKHLFFADADWLVMPPIILNQYRLWVRNGIPYAFASWAALGAEAADRMSKGVRRLSPAEWKSGDELWLVDFVAPFGGGAELVEELKQQTFADKVVRTLRADPKRGVVPEFL